MMQVMSKSDTSFFARNDHGGWRRPVHRVTFPHLYPEACGRTEAGFACLVSAKYGQSQAPGDYYLRSQGIAELPDGTRCMAMFPHKPGRSARPGDGWVPHHFFLQTADGATIVHDNSATDRLAALDPTAPNIASLIALCQAEARRQPKGQV